MEDAQLLNTVHSKNIQVSCGRMLLFIVIHSSTWSGCPINIKNSSTWQVLCAFPLICLWPWEFHTGSTGSQMMWFCACYWCDDESERPVAFLSRSLNKSELHMASIEKEATAIVKAVRKWSHLLLGHHFRLVTDQQSVSFMFDDSDRGKIKNAKIMRWRLELMQYSYDIVFRAGKHNTAPDTLR